jgi:hypothetical protein
MLMHQYLLEWGKKLHLAEREGLARDWLDGELRGGRYPENDDLPATAWGKQDWQAWKRNLGALQALAGEGAGEQYDGGALAVAQEVLAGARIRPAATPQEVEDGKGIQVWLVARSGERVSRPVDFDTYWQDVFLNLFQPGSELQRPVCQRCGKALRPSKKLGKPSRARLCPSCQVAKHRERDKAAARERWRADKRRQRQGPGGGKPKS